MLSNLVLAPPTEQLDLFWRVRLDATFTAVVIGNFFLVAPDLAIQLVRQRIDRGVHVRTNSMGKELATRHLHSGFRLMPVFLNFQHNMYVRYVVVMALQSRELSLNILFQSRGYVYMMSADIDMHMQCSYRWFLGYVSNFGPISRWHPYQHLSFYLTPADSPRV